MRQTFRILVTASRTWKDRAAIEKALKQIQEENPDTSIVLMHGACRVGGDPIADEIASELGFRLERYPANWDAYGNQAAHLRNYAMVKRGADVCLAFIKNGSPGATKCAALAEKEGIPTYRYEWNVDPRELADWSGYEPDEE